MNSEEALSEHLKKIQDLQIHDLLRSATVVEPKSTISQVIGIMSKTDTYDVFCVKDGFILASNVRRLLASRDISDMKISSLLDKISPLTIYDTVEKAAAMMSHYRVRSAPVVENGKLVGVITAKDIVNLMSKQNLNWIKANSVLTPNPVTLSSIESLAKARKIMISNRFDHIPIRHKGKVKQVLTSMHLLQMLIPEERIGKKQIQADMLKRFESYIGNIGSTRVPECNTNDPISKVIESMLRADATCCLLTLWGDLHGIITYRDLLNLVQKRIESKVPLYIVGMPQDLDNAEIVKTKFQKIIKNLIKVYPEVEESRASIKLVHSGLAKKHNYEVAVRIITPYRTYNYTELGWDLSKVFDTLGRKIIRNLAKRSKRRWKVSVRQIDKKDIF